LTETLSCNSFSSPFLALLNCWLVISQSLHIQTRPKHSCRKRNAQSFIVDHTKLDESLIFRCIWSNIGNIYICKLNNYWFSDEFDQISAIYICKLNNTSRNHMYTSISESACSFQPSLWCINNSTAKGGEREHMCSASSEHYWFVMLLYYTNHTLVHWALNPLSFDKAGCFDNTRLPLRSIWYRNLL
jgi:hypothetical protein